MADQSLVDQSPPHALGPEKSILSSCLCHPGEFLGKVIEAKLTASHFYLPAHATIFTELTGSFDADQPVEMVELVQRFADKGILDKIGGPQALYEIYTYAPNNSHFDRHVELIQEKFVLRKIIATCTEAIAKAHTVPDEVVGFLDEVESSVFAIRDNIGDEVVLSLDDHVDQILEELGATLRGHRTFEGMPTGFRDLDRMCGGLEPGQMFVIAARPSMGKTSIAMNIAESVCLDNGVPTQVFSLEMTTKQLIQRLIYSRASFNRKRYNGDHQPSKEELQKVKDVSDEIRNSKLHIDDTPSISIAELRAKARRAKKEFDTGLIVIDYLQLMRSQSKQAEAAREREIGQISAGIKGLAKELSLPIIVLAQLNRAAETRTGANFGVPRMADLRESGTIEQDSDLVGLLYRPEYYATSDEEKERLAGEAELMLAKNRNGPTGNVPLVFISELMRFEPRARDVPGY